MKFQTSLLSKNRLKAIKGGTENLATCTNDCPGGGIISCDGGTCSTGTDPTYGAWVQCDTNTKAYCPVV